MNTKNLVMCGFFSALICVCAFVTIPLPFTPVPITLQTFAVSFAGIYLGKKYGVISVVTYISLGVAGLPVFSGMRSGAGMLIGPTGGFILGFAVSVFLIGLAYEQINKRFSNVNQTAAITFSIVFGNVAMYICGISWYMNSVNAPFAAALAATVMPFILGDIFKLFLAVTLSRIFIKRKVVNA